jgi:hypothetical protein
MKMIGCHLLRTVLIGEKLKQDDSIHTSFQKRQRQRDARCWTGGNLTALRRL